MKYVGCALTLSVLSSLVTVAYTEEFPTMGCNTFHHVGGNCCIADEEVRVIPCAPGMFSVATRDEEFPRARCGVLVQVVNGICSPAHVVGGGGGDLAYATSVNPCPGGE